MALFVFDDLVEHTEAESAPLFPRFLPAVVELSFDPSYELRQVGL